jgi:fatty-acyl-CoA synthase
MSKQHATTLVEMLDNSAESYPQGKLVFVTGRASRQELSFCDLAQQSKRYASGLRRLGLKQGELVGLLFSTRPEFILSLMGAMRAGGVAVPLPTYSGLQSLSGHAERLTRTIEHSAPRFLITEPRFHNLLRDALGETFFQNYRVLLAEEIVGAGDDHACPPPPHDALCLVQYTSGSTGTPKGVALQHRNVLAGIAAIKHGMRGTREDIACSWLPLFHDMGLIGLLCTVAFGGAQYLHTQRSFIGNPGAWLHEFMKCAATIYTGPNFSFAHMLSSIDDAELEGLDLSRWRVAFNGSEPINPLVVEQFVERFAPYGFRPETMFPVYGMAEATLALSFSALNRLPVIHWFDGPALANEGAAVPVSPSSPMAKGLVAVGEAVLNHTVRVVDAAGMDVPENRIGEIEARGPAVMVGYYADAAATEEVLRDGWLRTGDLGFISAGLLFVTGRSKELVIINGRKFYPADIEQIAQTVPGVYQGHCIAFGLQEGYTEQMVVAVETELRHESDRADLSARLQSIISPRTGLGEIRICLLKRGAIPRTSSGKMQRLLFKNTFHLRE